MIQLDWVVELKGDSFLWLTWMRQAKRGERSEVERELEGVCRFTKVVSPFPGVSPYNVYASISEYLQIYFGNF